MLAAASNPEGPGQPDLAICETGPLHHHGSRMGSWVSADALRRLCDYRLEVDGGSKSESTSSVSDGACAHALRFGLKWLEESCFTRAG